MSTAFTFRDTAFLGGRSGAALWTPAQLTTALYLDSFAGGTPQVFYNATSGGSLPTDGSLFARWEDQSGNARPATQANSSLQPYRRAGLFNSIDSASFSGTDTLSHSLISSSPTNLTIAGIVKINANNGIIWSHRSEATRLISVGSGVNSLYFDFRSNSSGYNFINYAVTLSQLNIFVATLDVGSNSHKFRVNGAERGSNTTNFSGQNFTSTLEYIGGQEFGSGLTPSLNGDLPSLLIMNSTISVDDAERLEGFWAHKYGVSTTLEIGHTYRSTPHTI